LTNELLALLENSLVKILYTIENTLTLQEFGNQMWMAEWVCRNIL